MIKENFNTRDITDIVKDVAFFYPEINSGVLKHYIMLAIIDFARQSGIIRRTIKLKGQGDSYFLDYPEHRIHKVLKVRIDGECIEPVCSNCFCEPNRYKYDGSKLTICHFTGCDIEVDVILIPRRDFCEIDEDIIDMWSDAIRHRVNATLMTGNDKRFRSVTQARLERQYYLEAVDEARNYIKTKKLGKKIVNVKSLRNRQRNSTHSLRY